MSSYAFLRCVAKVLIISSFFSAAYAEILDPEVAEDTCLDYSSRLANPDLVGSQAIALNVGPGQRERDAKGCIFANPPVFDEDQFSSSDLDDLDRGIGGWYINPASNSKDVLCSVRTTVLYGPIEYKNDEYRMRCGKSDKELLNLRTLEYQVDNYGLVPGEVVDLEVELYEEGEFLSHPFNFPEYGICGITDTSISCVEHPCKDDNDEYVPINAHYTRDLGDQNQRDGSSCQLLHCGWEDSALGREIKPVSEYVGEWVNGSCIKLEGCPHEGVIYDEGKLRPDVEHWPDQAYTADNAPFNSACEYHESTKLCEFVPGINSFDWSIKPGSLRINRGYWGANTKRCNATKSCRYQGEYYEPGIHAIPGCLLHCASNGYAYCEDDDVIF